MFPDFRPRDVIASQVARARYAEPVHTGGRPRAACPSWCRPPASWSRRPRTCTRRWCTRTRSWGWPSVPPTPCSSVSPTPGLSRWPREHRRHLHRAPHARAGCRSYAQQRARDRPRRGVARRGRARVRGARGRDLGHLGRSRPRHRVRLRGRPAHRRRAAGLPGLPVHLRPARPRGAGGRVQLPEHLDRHGDRRGPGHGHGRHRAHLRPRAAAHGPARRGSGGHAGRHGRAGHGEHRPRDPALRLGLDGRGGCRSAPSWPPRLYTRSANRAHLALAGVAAGAVLAHPSRVRGRHRDRAGAVAGSGASCWPRDRRAGVRSRMPPCCAGIALGVAGAAYGDDPQQGLARLAHSREPLPPRAAGGRRRRRAPRVRADDRRELRRARRRAWSLYAGGAAALLVLAVVRAPWVAGGDGRRGRRRRAWH